MAHNKVTIDVEARFVDNLTGKAGAASDAIDDIGQSAKDAKKGVDQLGKSNPKPKIDVDDNRFIKKMDNVDRKLDKLGNSKTNIVLRAMDKASSVIGKVMNKGRNLANKTFTAMAKLKDTNAMATLRKITNAGESLTRKTWRVGVTIIDKATAPLRILKNTLFSIKGLVAAITAGLAAKQFVLEPISLADAYSSAQIGFSTLLGESQGQQMMDDLDAFAKATPFKSAEVIGQTQRMIAMGWDAENIIEDMTTIGDAAAATGKGEQGLQQIVTALAQIKTKGKLSTEELNQLAEAGVSAKKYIAEGLGYGSGDAGIAKMTKDLEDGAISSGKALEALLSGMQEYQGMMDKTANETVEGLWSQIQDTFEINIFRRWGQGLQDGAKKGFGSVVQLLDEADGALEKFGDTVYEVGSNVSNWLADKFGNAVNRVLEITDSFDFKEASLGKKISMLWKGVVSDPLKEWWEGGGQEKTAKTAGKIGSWMGEMLTKGLLAIFGMTDVLADSDFGEEGGMSVAQSFTKGFLDNFDGKAITDAFVDAVGDVWGALPTWAKMLLGGYAVAKAGTFLGNAVSGIGTLVGSTATMGAGNVMTGGSGLLGLLGTTGVAGVGASGVMGKLANTGYALMGGTSALSVGGGLAALAGTAGIAGGAALGASTIKGGLDLYGSYKAFKAGDKTEGNAKLASGVSTLGMAGTGAAIGSVFGPLGTLIGGGIGGGIGWLFGKKSAEQIRETKYEIEGAAEAIEDAQTEEEKLAALNEAAFESMKRHMGDIKLSASEIERIADQIVWGDDLGSFEKFNSAVQNAESSLQSLKNATDDTEKWLWKAGLGVKFNDDEVESIKASFDEYINSAKSYVENKHYEFQASAELILDLKSKEGKAILEEGNAFFVAEQEKLDKAGKELGDALTKALKDGIINADEEKVIVEAQNKIAEITRKINDAEQEAEIELIKVKFGSGKLDLDSFDSFMAQMETTLNERTTSAEEALKIQIKNLNLRFPKDKRNSKEYKEQLQTIIDSYDSTVESIKADVLGVELNIIGDAYEDVLGKDPAKKLQNALEESLAQGIHPKDWTVEEAKAFLGIDDLSDDTAKAIATMLGGVADQIEIIEVDGKLLLNLGIETEGEPKEEVEEKIDKTLPETVEKTVGVNIEGEKNVQTTIDILAEDFGIPPEHAATVALLLTGDKELLNQIDVSELAKEFGIPESQAKTIIEKLTGEKSIENRLEVLSSDFGIPDSISKKIKVNLTAIKGKIVDTIGNVFGGGSSGTQNSKTKNSRLRSMGYGSNSSTGQKYRGGIVGGPSAFEAFARGGEPDFPDGGIVGGTTKFIRVNEEYPEMIIPLSSQRKKRARYLWEKTGKLLDVPGFARGGVTAGERDPGVQFKPYNGDNAPSSGGGDRTIKVEIGSIPIAIHVNGDGDIVEAIEAKKAEIAEAVAGVIADELGAIFENTPTKRGA